LKKSRFNLNNQELISLNSIFKINEKIKLKANALFNWDEQAFNQQNIQNYMLSSTNFTNTESSKINRNFFSGSGTLDFEYDISKNELLEIDVKYRKGNENSKSRLEFNNLPMHQSLYNNSE